MLISADEGKLLVQVSSKLQRGRKSTKALQHPGESQEQGSLGFVYRHSSRDYLVPVCRLKHFARHDELPCVEDRHAANTLPSRHHILSDFELLIFLHEIRSLGSTSCHRSISGLSCSIGVKVPGLRVLEAQRSHRIPRGFCRWGVVMSVMGLIPHAA